MLSSDNLLLHVPGPVERTEGTALSANEVNAVTTLDVLARLIVEHNQRLVTGEPVDWDAMTDLLGNAERACRRLRSSGPTDDGVQPVDEDVTPRAAVTRRPREQPPDTSPIYH